MYIRLFALCVLGFVIFIDCIRKNIHNVASVYGYLVECNQLGMHTYTYVCTYGRFLCLHVYEY